jgi:hypothetical protein
VWGTADVARGEGQKTVDATLLWPELSGKIVLTENRQVMGNCC